MFLLEFDGSADGGMYRYKLKNRMEGPYGIRQSWSLILNAWRYRRVAWPINIETGEASLTAKSRDRLPQKTHH